MSTGQFYQAFDFSDPLHHHLPPHWHINKKDVRIVMDAFDFLDEHATYYPIKKFCNVAKESGSGYYLKIYFINY